MMRIRIALLCLLASLIYLPGLAQLSFGVKVGGATLPYHIAFDVVRTDYYQELLTNTKTEIDNLRIQTMAAADEPGVNLFTNNPELLAELDNFNPVYSKPRRINVEFGAYFSVPISQRSRLRLEVAYHEYDYQLVLSKNTSYRPDGAVTGNYIGGIDINQPDSLYRYNNRGSVAIINRTIGRFIRPSLHFHYYFSNQTAFNIGASLSLPLKGTDLQGFSYTSGIVEQEVYDPVINTNYIADTKIHYEFVDRIDGSSISKNVLIPGINFGFLFKIRGLPKIEVRGSYHAPSIVNKHRISFEKQEFQIPSQIPPIEYSPYLRIDDFFSLSTFVEL